MDRCTELNSSYLPRTYGRLLIAVALVAGFTTIRSTLGVASDPVESQSKFEHRVDLPEVMPVGYEIECSGYAAAYAAALAALQQAQLDADAAYMAWYNCEYGLGGNTPSTQHEIPSAELSVLVVD